MSTRPAVPALDLATVARIRLVPGTDSWARMDPLRPAKRRCRGLAAVFSVALLALAGCGSNQHNSSTGTGRGQSKAASGQHTSAAAPPPVRLVYRHLFSLSAPLRDPASALISGGRFVFLGGLDAADSSTAGIVLSNVHRTLRTFSLPLAQHDAQGAALGGRVYVFGGGSFSELDHIISFDPSTGAVTTVGQLPRAQSDVAVAELGGTAYIVGGYDGTNWLTTILAWRPGSRVRVVGHLPVGLRYSAVSAVDGRLLVIGGSTPTVASDAIYSFDPATGAVKQIGRLRDPITHASAATLGSTVYLIGGRGDLLNAQTAAVWAINPETGAIKAAGRLPQALSDTGTLTVGDAIVVAGGLDGAGGTSSAVGEFVPPAGG